MRAPAPAADATSGRPDLLPYQRMAPCTAHASLGPRVPGRVCASWQRCDSQGPGCEAAHAPGLPGRDVVTHIYASHNIELIEGTS